VDVSCYVHERGRGQRIGQRLYGKLLQILALQGHHAAFAGIALPNDASVRLHESVGFEAIGVYREVGFKAGAWRDTAWYRRGLDASQGDPSPPRPLHELGLGVLHDA
jgi:phosphinothricin acetyltransferase